MSILWALRWEAQITSSLPSTLKGSVELRQWLLIILETLEATQKLTLSPRGQGGGGRWIRVE